jgi:hypothetical protein
MSHLPKHNNELGNQRIESTGIRSILNKELGNQRIESAGIRFILNWL